MRSPGECVKVGVTLLSIPLYFPRRILITCRCPCVLCCGEKISQFSTLFDPFSKSVHIAAEEFCLIVTKLSVKCVFTFLCRCLSEEMPEFFFFFF